MSNSFAAPWTVACQAPLSVAFPSHEYWSGLLFPSPGDLPNPRTEPISPALAGEFFTTEPQGSPTISGALGDYNVVPPHYNVKCLQSQHNMGLITSATNYQVCGLEQ